jgi:hypothetical protein
VMIKTVIQSGFPGCKRDKTVTYRTGAPITLVASSTTTDKT